MPRTIETQVAVRVWPNGQTLPRRAFRQALKIKALSISSSCVPRHALGKLPDLSRAPWLLVLHTVVGLTNRKQSSETPTLSTLNSKASLLLFYQTCFLAPGAKVPAEPRRVVLGTLASGPYEAIGGLCLTASYECSFDFPMAGEAGPMPVYFMFWGIF